MRETCCRAGPRADCRPTAPRPRPAGDLARVHLPLHLPSLRPKGLLAPPAAAPQVAPGRLGRGGVRCCTSNTACLFMIAARPTTAPSAATGKPISCSSEKTAGRLGPPRALLPRSAFETATNKAAQHVAKRLLRCSSVFPLLAGVLTSITASSSLPLSAHRAPRPATFFCDAQTWQKGGIENAIGAAQGGGGRGMSVSVIQMTPARRARLRFSPVWVKVKDKQGQAAQATNAGVSIDEAARKNTEPFYSGDAL